MSAPLPCPFCGGTHTTTSAIRDGYQVSCDQCGASVHAFNPNALATAAAKWNSRPPAPALAPLIDALGCFWNAALYATHEHQDATANAVMNGMVEGVAAVAERLKQHGGVVPTYTERAGLPEALLSSVLLGALRGLSAVAEATTFSDQYPRECEAARVAIAQAEAAHG